MYVYEGQSGWYVDYLTSAGEVTKEMARGAPQGGFDTKAEAYAWMAEAEALVRQIKAAGN